MAYLQGSANFVWCTDTNLGSGAAGTVYKGVNKNTGKAVAVKTFHNDYLPDQWREFEVIQKVKHENIVKLLAIEEDQDYSRKVIVMELCTGGSLYSVLLDPENTYGLKEEEVLLVLKHLTAGMKYLRDNNLIHRDVKPGNIMKFICDDGSVIFKLADFGSARELQEGEQFKSFFHGTEEYAHPDLYEKALLRQPGEKTFGASVDLWSTGVTLYHVATGNVPFRPYGSDLNTFSQFKKKTMHYMTTQKESGVISGVQHEEEGPIEWSREFPKTCQLSKGLQKLIVPIIGGLMEANPQKMWSFDRFFSTVDDILQCRILHIFFVNKSQIARVYVHPNSSYGDLQSLIHDETGVEPVSQYLLFQGETLLNVLLRGYPVTQETEPIFLFIKDDNSISASSENDLPDIPQFTGDVYDVKTESDHRIAKKACSVGYEYKRRIERDAKISFLTRASVAMLISVIVKELDETLSISQKLQDSSRYAKEIADVAMRSETLAQNISCSCTLENATSSNWEVLSSTVNDADELIHAIQDLYQRYATDGILQNEWSTATRKIKCPFENRVPNVVSTLVGRLRESWELLLRNRKACNSRYNSKQFHAFEKVDLSYNDKQFHALEKIKVNDYGRNLQELFERDTRPSLLQQASCMTDWYIMAQAVISKCEILKENVKKSQTRLNDLVYRVTENNRKLHDDLLGELQDLKYKRAEQRQKIGYRTLTLSQEDEQLLKSILKHHKNIANNLEANKKLTDELISLTLTPLSEFEQFEYP